MPCGQKNKSSEISHSQTVTPPFAAMLGTTLRLKTATTNSNTRSKRPRTCFKCGWLGSSLGMNKNRRISCRTNGRVISHGVIGRERPTTPWGDDRSGLVRCQGSQPLLLRHRQRRSNIRKCRQMLVDIGFRVLHGDRPLLVPPVRLAHHA